MEFYKVVLEYGQSFYDYPIDDQYVEVVFGYYSSLEKAKKIVEDLEKAIPSWRYDDGYDRKYLDYSIEREYVDKVQVDEQSLNKFKDLIGRRGIYF